MTFRVRRLVWLSMAVAVLLSAGGASAQTESAEDVRDDPPNVVIFMLDTLRPDYLGMHGHRPDPAPFLAERAATSVVFDRAYSSTSWTPPAVASLFTSVECHEHKVFLGSEIISHADIAALSKQIRVSDDRAAELWASVHRERHAVFPLSPDFVTLAETFRDAGYFTYAVQTNYHMRPQTQMDQGFAVHVNLPLPGAGRDKSNANDAYDQYLRVLKDVPKDRPSFAYIHLTDPHTPYHERAPYFVDSGDPIENKRRAYLSEISFLDDYLRRFYESLDGDRETIVVYVSDHGEEFGDHGGWEHDFTLYDELNRVLFMISGPAIRPARVPENVSLIDVYPTLVDLAGIEQPDGLRGLSLVPLLRDEDARRDALAKRLDARTLNGHRMMFKAPDIKMMWSARQGDWKLIHSKYADAEFQLFNLATDPNEQTNLAGQGHAIEDVLREKILAVERTEGVELELTPVELHPFVKESLESMGYL